MKSRGTILMGLILFAVATGCGSSSSQQAAVSGKTQLTSAMQPVPKPSQQTPHKQHFFAELGK